jgi:phospholipid/cholesterol/gamma-HCH transport system substrate-binding protein
MPAEKTNFTVTEIKAGVLVLASVLVVVVFIGAIRGCGEGGEKINRYSAEFTSINGLDLGAEVRFGGVKAGKVVAIEPDPENRTKIRVEFEMPAALPVNHGSVATIEQISLTTGKHLEVTTGSKDEPLHVSGDRIRSETTSGGFVDIPDLDGVVSRLETALDGLITLLGVERAQAASAQNGEEMVDLAAVTAALERALNAGTDTIETVDTAIAENRDDLRLIVERLAALENAALDLVTDLNAAVDENREPLKETVVNFAQLSEEASRRVEELTESLSVTLRYLESLGGDASGLVDSQRPTLEQILLNLEATTRNLKQFSQTLAERPNALVRGTGPSGRSDGGP